MVPNTFYNLYVDVELNVLLRTVVLEAGAIMNKPKSVGARLQYQYRYQYFSIYRYARIRTIKQIPNNKGKRMEGEQI
jgi:hypothetical protein